MLFDFLGTFKQTQFKGSWVGLENHTRQALADFLFYLYIFRPKLADSGVIYVGQ